MLKKFINPYTRTPERAYLFGFALAKAQFRRERDQDKAKLRIAHQQIKNLRAELSDEREKHSFTKEALRSERNKTSGLERLNGSLRERIRAARM